MRSESGAGETTDTRALRARLGHVHWIGGGSGAGKSTIARRVAERHGLRLYATDDVMADHARRCAPGGCSRSPDDQPSPIANPTTEAKMIRQVSTETTSPFPRRESFIDCRGVSREFVIDFVRSDDHRSLQAVEAVDGEGRYEFSAMSETDPYLALGRLRQIIRRELSTRYLHGKGDDLELAHDELKGRIGYGGVAVDGQFVSFDELLRLLQTYEGFEFFLRITDPADP